MPTKSQVKMEFHVSRKARDFYQFDEPLFSLSGNVVFANYYGARLFAQKMNQRRDLVRFPEQAIKAGQINAMGLIDEILHHVVQLYREQRNPQAMRQAMDLLVDKFGQEVVDETLRRFADEFPPLAVYRREIALDAYLAGQTAGVPNRQIVLEEMLMLWLANANPAFSPFLELFDDAVLEAETAYRPIITALHEFFVTQPGFGPKHQPLVDMLREPAIAVPHSLPGQLEYIRQEWGVLLGRYLYRLLGGLDLIREEEKLYFIGPGPAQPYDFAALAAMGMDLGMEASRYTLDRDWMPRIVLMAKSTYVWLDQLSKKYQRPIARLDQIPDEELDTLARWGISGLWLIGVWQRSAASKRIKQLCGNPDAVASAYSVYDYQIADELGGEAAFRDLKARAWKRGIRMAGDMVPNHVGIDGRWVVQHPDWFVALDHSPFPSYSFNGPDLSWDDRVGIFLEDHYYTRSDAAVVFRRLDRHTGSIKHIYHGNDGTRMPWNDTAQLNYLNPETREAVIQTILHVARLFPIIRFDAAMTLTKKHYQRLWFPEPGRGGDIATRSEHGLTKTQFDAAMPEEFWRQVVDRIGQEAPDTLLLAEAFWLMEGYFVRTLGMHRVYNSAFMHMLKAEDNAKYRTTIKNVLEFDPEILKRFVNFMNNPDEETAVAQFGKDDKYFGVCTLMVTMPGLPMFGHGQIEGLTEKYGMEYQRAYWDEQPDEMLIRRHEHEIAPLLHRRYLFAEVRDFLLYDFFGPEGYVNEDVFAYSNRAGEERALVVYHNKYASARGWIRTSVAYSSATGGNGERALVQKSLGEGLGLHNQDGNFCVFRDHLTRLEYIRSSRELHENGMYVELGAYQRHVFLGFRELQDNVWQHYAHLAAYLDGRGVPSIDEALKETFLQPIHRAFTELVNPTLFRRLMHARLHVGADGPPVKEGSVQRSGHRAARATQRKNERLDSVLLDEVENKALSLLQEIGRFTGVAADPEPLAKEMRRELEVVLRLPAVATSSTGRKSESAEISRYLSARLGEDATVWPCLLGWWAVHALGRLVAQPQVPGQGFEGQSRSWIDEWLLGKILAGTFQALGLGEQTAWRSVGLIKVLTTHQHWFASGAADVPTLAYPVLEALLRDSEVQQFVGVNRYQDVLWFNKEAFEELMWWLLLVARVDEAITERTDKAGRQTLAAYQVIRRLNGDALQSGYRLEELLRLAQLDLAEAPAARSRKVRSERT